MMTINRFITVAIRGIVLLSFFCIGCASKPPVVEAPAAPAVSEDVWSLLARGEGERARPHFLGATDVNAVDSLGRTPLHYAAENRDHALAAFFIALGAKVDALDNEQRTPLAISAEKIDPQTAAVLVNAGANIHHPMKSGSSPALTGIRENGAFLASLLNPASLSSVDSQGRTVLHLASDAGNSAAAETIIGAGADISKRDNNGKTALDIALERSDSRNHAETAESLILAGAVSEIPLYSYYAPAARSSNYNIRSADGMAPLHYIAREGYIGYLIYLLEKNIDVNIKNASGATPLHEAARQGNVAMMETLLNHGAEINAQDAKGNTALHIAVPPSNHLQALELFLSRGADPNLRDEHGDSPLHIAIILNCPREIIQTLLEGGSDVTIRNSDGKTPLYLAIERNRINDIPLLLSYKSDIFAADNNGVTPFEKALGENQSILFTLINGDTVFQNDSAGNTMLHIAVGAGADSGVINYILDHNASINARNKAGDTSLNIAVRLNEEEAGAILLNRGADIFAANTKGENPLYLTFPPAGAGHSELRQWMLNPQTLGVKDGAGNTALHYISFWRFDTWIPLLIQLGAKTESPNATGETPLFIAVKQDSASTIKTLAANGALLSARDSLGNSALHAAVRWHALNSGSTLVELGLDINSHSLNGKTPLHDSIRLGMPDMEVLLIRLGADLEVRDAEGNTPFMEAVIAGNTAMIEQLAELGSDTNTRNFRGDTALHIAAAMERTDIATLLLGWGASIHAKNARGRTPFQDAVITSSGLVRTLLTKDRIHSSDDDGSSPLHIAVRERAGEEILRIIIELGVRLSSVDSEGRTALRIAVDMEDYEAAKFLSDSGTDVFITARDNKTAAEIVIDKGEIAVRAVFSGKAINSRDASGNSILHYAARYGDPSIVSVLLTLGADKQARNIAAESPADIASRWNNLDAAALLN